MDNMNTDHQSIHDRFEEIKEETGTDKRKAEISKRIKTGDTIFKTALLVAFWGFWIFWIIVALT